MLLFVFFFFCDGDLRSLVDAEKTSGGSPSLPAGSRSHWLAALKCILVNSEALEYYLSRLERMTRRQVRRGVIPSEQETETIVLTGLDDLSDSAIAQLLLSPAALRMVHEAINELAPDAWLKTMEEEGQKAMEKDGIQVPPRH